MELADAVVSPSAYLVDWMRREMAIARRNGRDSLSHTISRRPERLRPERRRATDRVQRISFFGRLEERKGLRPFAAGLNALDRKLLEGVDLDFVGRATPAWPPERVRALLTDDTRAVLREISFATDLDQQDALARLSRPGTLAVMPSLEDNSPNAVYECLERAIPFRASHAGGTAELIAEEDRPRVTFAPTAAGVEQALAHALTNGDALRPARASFDGAAAVERWLELVSRQPDSKAASWSNVHTVQVVAHTRHPTRRQQMPKSAVSTDLRELRAAVRLASSRRPSRGAERLDCVPRARRSAQAPNSSRLLVRAQTATDADVVTCGVAFAADERANGALLPRRARRARAGREPLRHGCPHTTSAVARCASVR